MNEPSPALNFDTVTTRLRVAGCVFAEEEAKLLLTEAKNDAELEQMIEQRESGRPLEHIVGWAEFDGLRIAVGAGVFVPRHRTEFLVAQAAKLTRPGSVVLDMCCGSGALGLALATRVGSIELHATDVESEAVLYARRILAAIDGQVYEGDLFAPLPAKLRGRINTLLANVPYVPTDSIRLMPAEARLHEPRTSLDGGASGLDIFERVAMEASVWLAPGGVLLSEISLDQADKARGILSRAGLRPKVISSKSYNATIVIGRT